MTSEIIAITGTLAGVFLGGLINYIASRNVKNHEWKLSIAKEQSAVRQKLYSEFFVEAQRLIIQSHEEKLSSLNEFDALSGKFAEITLIAPDDVVEAANQIVEYAITSHGEKSEKETGYFSKIKMKFITAARRDITDVLAVRAE